jgi:hypothetical protein
LCVSCTSPHLKPAASRTRPHKDKPGSFTNVMEEVLPETVTFQTGPQHHEGETPGTLGAPARPRRSTISCFYYRDALLFLKCLVASVWPFEPSEWPFDDKSPCPIPDDVLLEWLRESEDGTAKLAHYLWEFAAAGPEGVQLQQPAFREVVQSLSDDYNRSATWLSARMTMDRAGKPQTMRRDNFVAKAEQYLVFTHCTRGVV